MRSETSPKPTSIHPGPALLGYLDSLGPRDRREGVSRIVERLADRYTYMVRASLPPWSLDEWILSMEILFRHDTSQVSGLQVLGLVIQSAIEHKKSGLPPSREPNSTFAYQAKRLTEAQQAAVAEVVEGYRRRHAAVDREAVRDWLLSWQAPGIDAASMAPPEAGSPSAQIP
ncbi:MAG: hypothetical protein ACREPQ_00350 [Rhodanobacter sp.]